MKTDATAYKVSDVYQRVAVVDDVFALPSAASLSSNLVRFWAEVESDEDTVALLSKVIGSELTKASDINDDELNAIFENRDSLASIKNHVSDLFEQHDQRFGDVNKIVDFLKSSGLDVHTFSSTDELFKSGTFSLVFLDLFLDGEKEGDSSLIAKRIYTEFKAFVFLMSDKPDANSIQEEFRSRSWLLKGFFKFCTKEDLCDIDRLSRHLDSLPRDIKVCHQIHDFVLSIDRALGGPFDAADQNGDEDSPTSLLYGFVKTLRSLALSDYAMLCELTLRDEGHPLGDYMIRLLGTYLTQQLLEKGEVRAATAELDKMRFTEFLPFVGDSSEAMKDLYASSITETISNPWGDHPWEKVSSETDQTEGAADER